MGRLVWVSVGAVGGIYTYRKGERAVAALQAQEALRVARSVAMRRRSQNPSMALHPASGGPALHAVPAQPSTGLRIGRFRITRTDEAAPPIPQTSVAAVPVQAYVQPPRTANGQDRDVVDITEAARRGRRPGVTARRKAR